MSKALSTEIIKDKVGKRVVRYSAMHFACAERMYERIKGVMPYFKKPNLKLWADTLRKMEELDGIPLAEICPVFAWANQHEFWGTNILSPDKLRKQFARLHTGMIKDMGAQRQPRRTRDISFAERVSDRSWAESQPRKTRDIPIREQLKDISWLG